MVYCLPSLPATQEVYSSNSGNGYLFLTQINNLKKLEIGAWQRIDALYIPEGKANRTGFANRMLRHLVTCIVTCNCVMVDTM